MAGKQFLLEEPILFYTTIQRESILPDEKMISVIYESWRRIRI